MRRIRAKLPVQQQMRFVIERLCFYVVVGLTLFPAYAEAQITPDGTLPTVVEQSENLEKITGGERVGNNIFHSFKEFSIPEGIEAIFENGLDVENIFTRVTGEAASSINGLLRTQGEANFFLVNPNGIIFGENAQLDVGGSFMATTADSIQFEDGTQFAVLGGQEKPILTVSVPIGLGFGNDPGAITVKGTGHNMSRDPQTFEPIKTNRPAGLQVLPGKTLGLVGGNINLEGGNLTAEGGRIELGSVGSGETVRLIPDNSEWKLNYQGVEQFQDINFSQASSADASGNGGGSIRVQGRQVNLVDGSIILTETLGNSSGEDLIVKASESIDLVTSFISNITRAAGQSGDIVIETENLRVFDGARIASTIFAAGNSGNLSVTAENIEVRGVNPLEPSIPSGISTTVELEAMGNGGDVTIETKNLRVTDGAQIENATFGAGNSGDLNIIAENIEVRGVNPLEPSSIPSRISTTVSLEAMGNGGDVTIETENLRVSNLGFIDAATFGSGDGGNLHITGSDIEITGSDIEITSADSFISFGLATTASPGATGDGGDLTIEADRLFVADGAQLVAATAEAGDGGDLTIEADRLFVADGAQLVAATDGAGDGGNLTVRAGQIELTGTASFTRSGLFANATTGNGNGGNIDVATDSLIINDGATINASNFQSLNLDPPGTGSPGNINIRAETISLAESSITANTLIGDRGNIILDADSIQLIDGSEITTNAESTDGGNINIDTDSLTVLDRSVISANTSVGQGGNIQISTEGLFRSANSQIEASSELGIDGTVNINTEIDSSKSFDPISPKFFVAEEALIGSCFTRRNSQQGSFVYEGTGGLPISPSSAIDSEPSLSSQLPEVKPNSPTSPAPADSDDISSSAETIIYPAQTAQKWQVGEPIIEPTNLIKTADGRLLWVRKQVDSVSLLICQ